MQSNLSRWIAGLSAADAAARVQAAEALARLGTDARPAAVALVLACGDETEEVREAATAALEELGPPAADDADHLASFLGGRSADVGYWAATLLGRLQGEAASAVDALAQALASSPHAAVRQRAAWALGEIGPASAAALPALQQAANDADPRLSRLAQQAIGHIAGR